MNLKDLLVNQRFYSVLAIFYFAVVLFPGTYLPLDVGLDPSWRYAINYLPHSAHVFGRDVAFTYGPLGYFLVPLNIGSNLVLANVFHVLMHGLMILILLHYAWTKSALPVIFFVFSFTLASLVGVGLTDQYEYSYLLVSCALIALSYKKERLPIIADFINPLLAGMFLFMKFSLGLASVSMIAVLAIVRILRGHKDAWRSALLTCGTLLVTIIVLAIQYCKSPRNFVAWLVTSWHMADGYSIAMSLLGGPHVVAWALIALAAYLALLVLLAHHWSTAAL